MSSLVLRVQLPREMFATLGHREQLALVLHPLLCLIEDMEKVLQVRFSETRKLL